MSIPVITAFTKEDFRKWLSKNHLTEHKVAIVLHKRHTGKSAPTHRELMEEAICFGWIDTTIKRLDEDTYLRHFSKRTKNSRWSDNTLGYAKRLQKEGKMVEQGLLFYKMGLAKPTHDHGIPNNPNMPLELKEALSRRRGLLERFEAFSPSVKRTYYRWFLGAKLPETRTKRIKRILENTLRGSRNVF